MAGGAGPRSGIGRGIGIGTIVVALVGGWVLGVDPLTILGALGGGSGPVVQRAPAQAPAGRRHAWRVRRDRARRHRRRLEGRVQPRGGAVPGTAAGAVPGRTPTACGTGQAAMGPFYCPGDQKVYIDLAFYQTLRDRLGAPGDFAQAYVVAHEVGHHVQNLLGITQKMEQARGRVSQTHYNALSVRLELQADCLAGLWAHHADKARRILENGDVAEAMHAAARIGDDALQRAGGGAVVPESFTHGSSEQRQRWFDNGLRGGSLKGCDTFSANAL
jgi:predicted metalloprotease